MSGRNNQRNDRMEEDNSLPPQFPDNWVYSRDVDLIIHMPGTCTQCNDFLSHSMQASLSHLRSYRQAREERASNTSGQLQRAHQAIESHQREIVDLRRQLRSTREELDRVHEDLSRERSRASSSAAVTPPLRGSPYDERRHNTDTRRRVIQGREERGTRSYSSVVQTPEPSSSNVRRELPPPSSSSADSSAQLEPRERPAPSSNVPPQEARQIPTIVEPGMIASDSDGDDDTPRGERPEVVAGVAASPFGVRWTRWLDANGAGEDPSRIEELVPVVVEQFLFLDRLMHQRRSDVLAKYLGAFRSNAQSTRRERRSEAQAKACASWKKPDWATSTVFNRQTRTIERTLVSEVRNGEEEQQRLKAARRQSEVTSVAIGQGLMQGSAPHPNMGSPTNPQHRDHPAIWQSYFRNHYGHQRSLPRGLVRDDLQSPVHENLLRAFHRLGRLTSQMSNQIRQYPHSSTAVLRMRMFRMLSMEGEYRRIVTTHSLQIASTPAYQLGGPPPFIVDDVVVATTLAQMGYTFAEADAAWQYARNWIRQVDEDELRGEPLDIYREAINQVEDPNVTVPRHIHALDAARFVWDTNLERWRIDPDALNAANSALMGVLGAQGPSSSLASTGAAAPETHPTTAPVEATSASTRATAEVPPAVQEQVPDASMTGTGEPGEFTVAPQDQDMDVPGEDRSKETQAMDQT